MNCVINGCDVYHLMDVNEKSNMLTCILILRELLGLSIVTFANYLKIYGEENRHRAHEPGIARFHRSKRRKKIPEAIPDG